MKIVTKARMSCLNRKEAAEYGTYEFSIVIPCLNEAETLATCIMASVT